MDRWAIVGAILFAACNSSGGGGVIVGAVGGGQISGPGASVPMVHRASETPCTEARPPGSGGFDDPEDACKADADCTAGTNGRCVAHLGKPTFCSYDECAADADCGAVTACECRLAPSFNANTCVSGNCRVDADCGPDGFCSPSGLSLFSNCLTGIAIGSVGYFCHRLDDECVDDQHCGEPTQSVCLFDVSAKHWRCHDLVCTK